MVSCVLGPFFLYPTVLGNIKILHRGWQVSQFHGCGVPNLTALLLIQCSFCTYSCFRTMFDGCIVDSKKRKLLSFFSVSIVGFATGAISKKFLVARCLCFHGVMLQMCHRRKGLCFITHGINLVFKYSIHVSTE